MRLDARERRALNSIADGLVASAPELASRLTLFNRLASGEQMPEDPGAKVEEGRRERRGARPRRGHRRGRAGPVGRRGRERGPLMRIADTGRWRVIPVLAVMAATTVIVIAAGVVLSATGHPGVRTHQVVQCAHRWPVQCSGR